MENCAGCDGRTSTWPPARSTRPALLGRQGRRDRAEVGGRDGPRRTPIGLHECRHTYVTLMYEAGNPLEKIGDYVGHSGTYMTDRYRHLLPGGGREAAAKLDAYLAEQIPQL